MKSVALRQLRHKKPRSLPQRSGMAASASETALQFWEKSLTIVQMHVRRPERDGKRQTEGETLPTRKMQPTTNPRKIEKPSQRPTIQRKKSI